MRHPREEERVKHQRFCVVKPTASRFQRFPPARYDRIYDIIVVLVLTLLLVSHTQILEQRPEPLFHVLHPDIDGRERASHRHD